MEGRAIGAATILQVRVVWRYVCRDATVFTAMLTALLASVCHDSEKAQLSITHMFLTAAFRFVRPPEVLAALVSHQRSL